MGSLKIFTVQDAAAALKMGENAVLQAIRDGELGASNVSRGNKKPRWRLMESDIVKYMLYLRGTQHEPRRERAPSSGSGSKRYLRG